jgi:hypothetical protein
MSLRRAVEFNFKGRLEKVFQGTKYKVVEGVSREERPSPVIIVLAGEGSVAFTDIPDSFGNYTCDVSIIILSSIDVDSVDEHNDAIERVMSTLNTREAKRQSIVENLHVYDIMQMSVGEANDEAARKLGAVINYKATVNYLP